MKTNTHILLIALLAALALFACTDDIITPALPAQPEEPSTQPVTLSVRVAIGSGMNSSTRIAHGNLSQTGADANALAEEEAINRIEVWLFKPNGELEAYGTSDDPNLNPNHPNNMHIIQDMHISAVGWYNLVVTANTNIGKTGENGIDPITLPEIRRQTTTLVQDIKTDGMVMTADPTPIRIESGHNMLGNPAGMPGHPVDNPLTPFPGSTDPNFYLQRVNARIALTSLSTDFRNAHSLDDLNNSIAKGGDYVAYDRFVLDEIIFLNMREETALFPQTPGGRLTWLDEVPGYHPTFLFGSHVLATAKNPLYVGNASKVLEELFGSNLIAHGKFGLFTEEDQAYANAHDLIGNSGATHEFGFIGKRAGTGTGNNDLWRNNLGINGGVPLGFSPTPIIGNNLAAGREPFYIYAFENTSGTRGEGALLVLKGKLWEGNPQHDVMRTVQIAEDESIEVPVNLFVAAGLNTSFSSTDNHGNTYYVIWINRDDMPGSTITGARSENGTIVRNTQYNISVTITRPGSAGGSPSGTNTSLLVHTHIANWRSVSQNVEWRPN